MQPTDTPPSPARAPGTRPLTDAELMTLDELLAATPEPFVPCDVVVLDGYLCGVLVQPVLLEPATWLAHVFDSEGRPLPDDVDADWLARTTALVLRHHAALNRGLEEDGAFDPVLPPDDEGEDAEADPALADVPAASRPLVPWVAGFHLAMALFPDLDELDDDAVAAPLARVLRHLPAETDEEREVVATLDRELPLANSDEAIEDVVLAVADLYDITREARYRVETVRRDAPKVGRNDPCPCGSGKKFKHCHGA